MKSQTQCKNAVIAASGNFKSDINICICKCVYNEVRNRLYRTYIDAVGMSIHQVRNTIKERQ